MKKQILIALILGNLLFAMDYNNSKTDTNKVKYDLKEQIIQKYEYAKNKTMVFLKDGKAYLSKKSEELMSYAKKELKKKLGRSQKKNQRR